MTDILNHIQEDHYIQRSNWLRAGVLGANDGILSTASLAIGVAAASDYKEPIILATLAGVVAGALSMSAGEYVSVSSQTDIEKADINRQKKELDETPAAELQKLTQIYINRGLNEDTAALVAKELTEKDALRAHVRDELGINDNNRANPVQAALASGAAFTIGGALPLLVAVVAPLDYTIYALYASTLISLMLLGALSAKTGGAAIFKAVVRITFWGTVAMGLSALVGWVFGVNIA